VYNQNAGNEKYTDYIKIASRDSIDKLGRTQALDILQTLQKTEGVDLSKFGLEGLHNGVDFTYYSDD
jgi:hypothetical protein